MKLVPLAALLAAACALSAPALACSCRVMTPEEHVAETELIFIGTAKETIHSDEEGSETVYTVFAVKEMLKGKGAPGEELFISHLADLGGNCGINFEDGKEMLVLANDEPGEETPATTNLCTMAGASEAELRAALKTAGK